jgi:hypothetical protein
VAYVYRAIDQFGQVVNVYGSMVGMVARPVSLNPSAGQHQGLSVGGHHRQRGRLPGMYRIITVSVTTSATTVMSDYLALAVVLATMLAMSINDLTAALLMAALVGT